MDFLIADTFTASLARLTGDEQKLVKTTAFDLHMNPVNTGMQLHKLDRAKDKIFWSVRVASDIRIIVHKTAGSLLLCYADHHDKAYAWAERRKLETHPKTGAAQLVELKETTREVTIPVFVEREQPKASKPALFANATDDELLGYGVPTEWLNDVREATEDSLLVLADRLPGEAAEALLELATGGDPRSHEPVMATESAGYDYSVERRPLMVAETAAPTADPFEHPDAQRRFRAIANIEELQRALDDPWEKWTIFLHPEQRELVDRDYSGPARVSGSAGTGKTIVALHRAVHLARTQPGGRVLLTTFSDTLARSLHTKLKRLLGNQPRLAERIDVHSIDAIGLRLYKSHVGPADLASPGVLREIVQESSVAVTGRPYGVRLYNSP